MEDGLVCLSGLTKSVEVINTGLRNPPVLDANGKIGRAVPSNTAGMSDVHLFDGNCWVRVLDKNVQPYTPPTPEEGGFHIAYPSTDEELPLFGLKVIDFVADNGWCYLQPFLSDTVKEEALGESESLSYDVPKAPFVDDLLGRGGTGKLAYLEKEEIDIGYFKTTGLARLTNGEELSQDGLTVLSRELENLVFSMGSGTDNLDFQFGGCSKTMVQVPPTSSRELAIYKPDFLTDEDIDEGLLVENHLKFLQERKLALMYFIENKGGEVWLIPKGDLGLDKVKIPLGVNKLLVFNTDKYTYKYMPEEGKALLIQNWMYQIVQYGSLSAFGALQNDVVGIVKGPKVPEGDTIHVLAVETRLPGGSYGSDSYCQMLQTCTDGQLEIPLLRFDINVYCTRDGVHIPGMIYTTHGGFLDTSMVWSFDNKFFDISDDEAQKMNTTQRVSLEVGYSVLYKGGQRRETLLNRQVGVFFGDTGSDWDPMAMGHSFQELQTTGLSKWTFTGRETSITCSRISWVFGMRGPVATSDTACSSSLVGCGLAITGLRHRGKTFAKEGGGDLNRCNEALPLGICTQIGPGSYLGMCGIGAISTIGRCFTFDTAADGYERGEGCSCLYLRANEDYEDTKNQLACLLGAAINQDGRSASMTAPHGPSQMECIKKSMSECGLKAREITIAECHGTGTALGDPIEVGALRSCMEPRDDALQLTSSKSNIGHLEGGAGMAGLSKCVMMLQFSQTMSNVHLRQSNPHLDLNGFPVLIPYETFSYELNSGLSGVSSFGWGGTNARGDVFGQCRRGRLTAERKETEMLMTTKTCPLTLGPIDWLSGEPAKLFNHDGKKYHADVIRDEFASYDVSRHAYGGGFRFRREEVGDEEEGELDPDLQLFICGTWSGYEYEELEYEGDNWYSATIAIGEANYEMFHLCLNQDVNQLIYPARHNGDPSLFIWGPNAEGLHKEWIIKGPAGSLYEIKFKWGWEKKMIEWEKVEEKNETNALIMDYPHVYSICASFTDFKAKELTKTGDKWSTTFTIGATGKEDFHFLRDRDPQQAIYPKSGTSINQSGTVTDVPVRGPDDLRGEKNFQVRGKPKTKVTVTFSMDNGNVTVTTDDMGGNPLVWKSAEVDHEYYVVGSWSKYRKPVPMQKQKDGVYTCTVKLGNTYNGNIRKFVDVFQVILDEDPSLAICPDIPDVGTSGMAICEGPALNTGNSFMLKGSEPKASFVITLDLKAIDKRKVVTWAAA